MKGSQRLDGVRVIGHRGDPSRAPENTLPSLEAALRAGAHGVEFDVRISGTGTPVLIHDATVDRTTTGSGRVSDLTDRELATLDAGGWFAPRYAGTRVPTLADAVALLESTDAEIFCEVKAVRADGDVARILDAFRGGPLRSRSVIITLDRGLLRSLRRRDTGVRLGWVVDRAEVLDEAAAWAADDPHALLDPCADLLLASPARTRHLVATGLPLATWTVDDPEEARALADLGVRWITTNRVAEMATHLGDRHAP